MQNYTLIISAIFIVATIVLITGYAILASHATTRGERIVRYIEIVLICSIACVALISLSGLTDHLHTV